jgi:hypothetical protein
MDIGRDYDETETGRGYIAGFFLLIANNSIDFHSNLGILTPRQ